MSLVYTHQRSAWLTSGTPFTTAPLFPGWPSIHRFVVHWPGSDGAIDGDPGESADALDDWIRSIQRNYYTHRGYNIGYNVGFDWLGGTWELRGEQYKCAANKGLNDFTFAGLVFVDLDGVITPQCVAAIQRFYQQLRTKQPNIDIMGHGEGPTLYPDLKPTPTQCPGPLQRLVSNGTFTATPPAPPNSPPTPLPAVTTYTVVQGDGWFYISRKVGVDTGRILSANNATLTTGLRVGQVLKIPAPLHSHTVPKGGSLWSAALALRMPASEQSYSKLRDQLRYKYRRTTLWPGDVLTA